MSTPERKIIEMYLEASANDSSSVVVTMDMIMAHFINTFQEQLINYFKNTQTMEITGSELAELQIKTLKYILKELESITQ